MSSRGGITGPAAVPVAKSIHGPEAAKPAEGLISIWWLLAIIGGLALLFLWPLLLRLASP